VAELNRSESRLCGSNSNPQKVLCDGHQTKIACEAQGTGFLGVSLGARPLYVGNAGEQGPNRLK